MTEKKDSWTVWGTGFPDNGGDVEILSYQECMYTMNEGMTITEDWIQTFETFDAIVAVNDLSALGAVQALKAANKLDEAAVIGIDGIDDAMKAVADGEMGDDGISGSESAGGSSLQRAGRNKRRKHAHRRYQCGGNHSHGRKCC